MTNLKLTITSNFEGYAFDISFSDNGQEWHGEGTCPSIEHCFDKAMEYVEKVKRGGTDE